LPECPPRYFFGVLPAAGPKPTSLIKPDRSRSWRGFRFWVSPPGSPWPAMGVPRKSRAAQHRLEDGGSPIRRSASPPIRRPHYLHRRVLSAAPRSRYQHHRRQTAGWRVAVGSGRRARIVDAKTFVREGTVKVGAHPFGVTIDPQSARLATDVESNDVSALDLKEAKLSGRINTETLAVAARVESCCALRETNRERI
jgi:hypothetical protein